VKRKGWERKGKGKEGERRRREGEKGGTDGGAREKCEA